MMLHFGSYSDFPYLTTMYLLPSLTLTDRISKIKQKCEEWNSPKYLDRGCKN